MNENTRKRWHGRRVELKAEPHCTGGCSEWEKALASNFQSRNICHKGKVCENHVSNLKKLKSISEIYLAIYFYLRRFVIKFPCISYAYFFQPGDHFCSSRFYNPLSSPRVLRKIFSLHAEQVGWISVLLLRWMVRFLVQWESTVTGEFEPPKQLSKQWIAPPKWSIEPWIKEKVCVFVCVTKEVG